MSVDGPSRARSWAVALRLAFVAGELDRAAGIVEAALADLEPLALLDLVVAPAMHDVGALWERDELTVADEHLATATLHRLLAIVAPRLEGPPPSAGPLAVLACPEGERHAAPLVLAESALRAAGFRVENLGADLPLGALLAFAERRRPAIVGLTCTMAPAGPLLAAIDGLARCCPETPLLVGGAGVTETLPVEPAVRMADLRALDAWLASYRSRSAASSRENRASVLASASRWRGRTNTTSTTANSGPPGRSFTA